MFAASPLALTIPERLGRDTALRYRDRCGTVMRSRSSGKGVAEPRAHPARQPTDRRQRCRDPRTPTGAGRSRCVHGRGPPRRVSGLGQVNHPLPVDLISGEGALAEMGSHRARRNAQRRGGFGHRVRGISIARSRGFHRHDRNDGELGQIPQQMSLHRLRSAGEETTRDRCHVW